MFLQLIFSRKIYVLNLYYWILGLLYWHIVDVLYLYPLNNPKIKPWWDSLKPKLYFLWIWSTFYPSYLTYTYIYPKSIHILSYLYLLEAYPLTNLYLMSSIAFALLYQQALSLEIEAYYGLLIMIVGVFGLRVQRGVINGSELWNVLFLIAHFYDCILYIRLLWYFRHAQGII